MHMWNILFCSLCANVVSPNKIQSYGLLPILCQSLKTEQGTTGLIIICHAWSSTHTSVFKGKNQTAVCASHCSQKRYIFLEILNMCQKYLGHLKKITSKNELENHSSFLLDSVCGNSKTKKRGG